MATLAALAVLLLSMVPVPTFSDYIYPYDPIEDSYLEEVASWSHPDGKGADLLFNLSSDCSRMVLVGYASPDDVRVTDRDLGTLAVLEPPGEPFEAKGAKWSKTDRWLAVWGRVEGADRDVLTVYDGSTLEVADDAPWRDLVDLVVIDSLCFFADDYILMVGGRDELGTSTLLILETFNDEVRSAREWPGNHSVLHMGEDSRHIMLVDSGGTITHYNGQNWTESERFEGALGTPTAWFVHWDYQWAFGDAEGLATFAYHLPYYPEFNITAGEGAVQGISISLWRISDVFVATARPEGGSSLTAWQLLNEREMVDVQRLDRLDLVANVTMMEPTGERGGGILVALEDGTLAEYRLDIRTIPVGLDHGVPDQEDGMGLETVALWPLDQGEGVWLTFEFNHGGSLIALDDYNEPHDIWIVNRSLETMAVIDTEEGKGVRGHAWSGTDSWLAVWGWCIDNGSNWMDIYDVPSFERNTSLGIEWVLEYVMVVDAIHFLEGDRVLAISGTGINLTSEVLFLDLRNRTVLREHQLHYTEYYPYDGFEVVGDRLVCLSRSGDAAYFSLDDYDLVGTESVPIGDFYPYDLSEAGWLFMRGHLNLSYHEGSLEGQAWTWSEECPYLSAVAWTRVVEGDAVIASGNRPFGGSEIQLWRDVGVEGREGMRLVSILNTSRWIFSMAADPAYPGLVAATTTDGCFVLYHVNVSGYPPAPTAIGNVPINGSIDWTVGDGDDNATDGNDTDGDGNATANGGHDAWGTTPPGMLVAGLALAVVALFALFIWLRRKGPH